MVNAVRPPTGLLPVAMRLRLNRTAAPPAGVTFFLKIGLPTMGLAVRLLALVQVVTKSPSFKARLSARHTSISAAEHSIFKHGITVARTSPRRTTFRIRG